MRNLCIVGLQWGDEGKGKIVDYYADRFHSVVRYNGGSNAGHTIVIGKKTYVFHLLPSGLLKDKKLLIGPGVAVDPQTLKEEVQMIKHQGHKPRLIVDGRCTVVTPLEKELDAFIEELRGANPIGTTKRGIGPSYAMRALRLTPRAGDLDRGTFDLKSALAFYRVFLKRIPPMEVWIASARDSLKGLIGDVGEDVMETNEAGHSVLFEGAQGVLLDLVHGTYPYVTGTHTLASYVPASLGIPAISLGDVMGVSKAYATRVGAGPFPTEIHGEVETRIRETGKEYGATTGRPRRVGWLDLVALKYAVRMNGVTTLALTKLDILTKLREFKVCTHYNIDGKETDQFSRALPDLGSVKPVYLDLPPLYGAQLTTSRLHRPMEKFVEFLEDQTKVGISIVSMGEERTATHQRVAE
ncbi:MAG: adenylosuccinate synthase [Thaumarchaeota archaeon]|nr:adenylosuccinate synthase [Nitrososphaerota archaeon]